MNIQDLKDVVEKAEQNKREHSECSRNVYDEYDFYSEQSNWLLSVIKQYVEDNIKEIETGYVDDKLHLSLTDDELDNLLNLIEKGLFQEGLSSCGDSNRKLYYKLVDNFE